MSDFRLYKIRARSKVTLRGDEPFAMIVNATDEEEARELGSAYMLERKLRPFIWANSNNSDCAIWDETGDEESSLRNRLKKSLKGVLYLYFPAGPKFNELILNLP